RGRRGSRSDDSLPLACINDRLLAQLGSEDQEDECDGDRHAEGAQQPHFAHCFTYFEIMSTILSRVSGLRIHALAPELGNISSSDFSGRSEIRMMGMSFLFDCDLSTSLSRLPLMLGRFTS